MKYTVHKVDEALPWKVGYWMSYPCPLTEDGEVIVLPDWYSLEPKPHVHHWEFHSEFKAVEHCFSHAIAIITAIYKNKADTLRGYAR